MNEKCEKFKQKIMDSNLVNPGPIIKFMMEELAKSGCALKPEHIVCAPCDVNRAGGFAPQVGIVLCENQIQSKTHLQVIRLM